jgi:hypothetical protein
LLTVKCSHIATFINQVEFLAKERQPERMEKANLVTEKVREKLSINERAMQ